MAKDFHCIEGRFLHAAKHERDVRIQIGEVRQVMSEPVFKFLLVLDIAVILLVTAIFFPEIPSRGIALCRTTSVRHRKTDHPNTKSCG